MMCCSEINNILPEFPKYGPQLERLILCDKPTKICWLRNCSNCSDAKVRQTIADITKRSGKDLKTRVKLTQWRKNKDTNRFQKYVEPGALNELQDHFLSILDEFLKHSYTKRCQAASFEADNKQVRESNGKVASAQIDFGEGFNCEAQDEIQAAHWNQATVR